MNRSPSLAPALVALVASSALAFTQCDGSSVPSDATAGAALQSDAGGVALGSPGTASSGGSCGGTQDGPLTITAGLTLSASTAAPGDTITGTVTFTNEGTSPVVVEDAVVAARPPGGTHTGGPFDDFTPTAPSQTLAPGASFTLTASRAFTAADPLGAWDLYPTFEDGSGTWHDGPDLSLQVAASGSSPSEDAGGGGGDAGNPIQAPLSGTVTAGQWQSGDISVPGVTLPSDLPFHYDYLLPANYDPSFTYPILVHEHEDMEGSAWYLGQNTDPLYLASASGADGWYNNTAWRTAYPCIIILPYADQTSGGADGNDALENFGGWTNIGVTGTGTTFSGDSGPNVFAVAGLVQSFIAQYSVNSSKVYITGDSLGGIGSWYMILMYNRVNGPSGKLFTAALPFAGVMELNGFGSGPTAAQIAQLSSVPVFAVSGANDGTSLPQDWNQPMWTALAGNSSYPPPPSGSVAGTSSFHYMQDPSLGHDVWDTYRPLPAGQPMYDWLFSQ